MMASYLDCQLRSRLAYACKGIEGRELFDTIVACAFKRGQSERGDGINVSTHRAAGAASAEQSREASARPCQQGQVARRQQGILPSPDPPTF